ncbi:VOC family protein [Luteitalea sp. TBR-22]|uniref:VOC family protein n=1 Tax=Luteitalea sp. TBR-22 TaxID=2802971 RepID=UPI001EF700E6|nr:VOC family protein [Luteitalea sp. TBR-22]
MKLWTGIVTDQLQASKAFYTRFFDARVIYEGEDGWVVVLGIGEGELAFMRPGLASQAPIFRAAFGGAGVWIAIDVEDAGREYQRLLALDAPIEEPLRDEPWGDRHFVLRDPNGIGVDVVERLTS